MTFSAFESSVESSRPVEIYTIAIGAEAFHYTTTEEPVTVGSNSFTPEALTRGRIGQGTEVQDSMLEIQLPASNEFVRRYRDIVPGARAMVTLQRVQRLDFPTPEVVTLFQGFVHSVAFNDGGKTAKVAVVPATVVLTRTIPRFTFRAACNNFLYDARCGIDPDDPTFKLTAGLVTAVVGSTITVAGANAFADGWFDAGFVEALGGTDARAVISHVGNDLELILPFPFDLVGQFVVVRAGCAHSIAVCKSKFDNVLRFGGFAFIPSRNPFENGII